MSFLVTRKRIGRMGIPGGSGSGASSLLRAVVTVAAAALRACGSVPVSLIAAVAARYPSVMAIAVSYNAGAVAFDFASPVVVKSAGSAEVQYYVGLELNNLVDKNLVLVRQGQLVATNTALVLTTEDGTDATVGDGDVDIVIYYSNETPNT